MKIEFDEAYQIAASLIAAEGDEPEFLSVVEAASEYAQDAELDGDQVEALLGEVNWLLGGAKVDVTFPDEVVMRL